MAPRVPSQPDHFHCAVTERHDHDHGLGFVLSNQVVENHVRASHGGPTAGVIAEAMQQVEHGISLLCCRLVTRGSVNVVVAVIARDRGLVEVMMNLTMWDIIQFPGQRGRPGNVHRILRRQQIRLQQGIRRINQAHPVGDERVPVVVRTERCGGDAPDALVVFLHGNCFCSFARNLHLHRIRRAEAEGDAAVGVHLGRDQRRGRLRRLSLGGLGRLRCRQNRK